MMRSQRGISKVEFAVAAALVAIFATVLLDRMIYYESVSERTYFDLTVRALKSGLRWRTAQLLTSQQPIDYTGLAAENPITWLDAPPEHYVGEVGDVEALQAGAWAYDPGRQVLHYRPRFASEFDEILDQDDKLVTVRWSLIYNADRIGADGIAFKLESAR